MSRLASIGLAVGLVYALFSYGGIRSPDGEVMYRTAESLACSGRFAIRPIDHWADFGVAKANDGLYYSKYGPAVPILASPLVWVALHADSIPGVQGLAALGPSHLCSDGLTAMTERRVPIPARSHMRRAVASLFNILVGAFGVLTMMGLLKELGARRPGIVAGGLAFAFGTPMLAYSGTFFSEPLVTLCLLRAISAIVAFQAKPYGARVVSWHVIRAGLWLALAVAAHITAAAWLPVVALYMMSVAITRRETVMRLASLMGAFAVGPLAAVSGLLTFNVARFGDWLETGRPAADLVFTSPWGNLLPLLTSWGKGLALFCPLAIVGIVAWPLFFKRDRWLACLLIGGVIVRVLLFASFHDWHGGFGLGPRYLLPEISVLVVGASLYLDRLLAGGRRQVRVALAVVCACVVQQVWFASGEIFSWWHGWRAFFAARGVDVLADDRLYRSFAFSPINPAFGSYAAPGPAVARALDVAPASFALLAVGPLCALTTVAILRARLHTRRD